MQYMHDESKSARLNKQFLLGVAREIRDALSRKGLRSEELRQMTEEMTLAAAVAMDAELFDDSASPVYSHLMYAGPGLETDAILLPSHKANFEEMAYFVVEELYEGGSGQA